MIRTKKIKEETFLRPKSWVIVLDGEGKEDSQGCSHEETDEPQRPSA
eukprot:g61241.t1